MPVITYVFGEDSYALSSKELGTILDISQLGDICLYWFKCISCFSSVIVFYLHAGIGSHEMKTDAVGSELFIFSPIQN
jgi:hypothetical protein